MVITIEGLVIDRAYKQSIWEQSHTGAQRYETNTVYPSLANVSAKPVHEIPSLFLNAIQLARSSRERCVAIERIPTKQHICAGALSGQRFNKKKIIYFFKGISAPHVALKTHTFKRTQCKLQKCLIVISTMQKYPLQR